MPKTPRVQWRAQAPPPLTFRCGRSMFSPTSGSPPSSPRNNSPSPDCIGRLKAGCVRTQDVSMEYPVSPRRSPRLNNHAGGRNTSSPFKGYKARFAIDDEDVEMGNAEPAKGRREEPTFPPALHLRRSPRRQRLEPTHGPLEPPSRGRTLHRESWPFTSVTIKLEPGSRQKRIAGGIAQAEVRKALRKERERRRSISPDKIKSAMKKREERKAADNLTSSSFVATKEELIRAVERHLTCPLRDCSPLTDLGDEIRVSWPEDEQLVTQKTIDNYDDFIGWVQ